MLTAFKKIGEFIFNRAWMLYAAMFVILFFVFDRHQVADDVLNASRPSADYVHAFSYGDKPFDKKEIIKANAYYQTLLLGRFPTPLMYANLGFCAYYLGDIDKAIKYYSDALKNDQRLYALYSDLGYLMMQKKEYKKAEELFLKALVLIPKSHQHVLEALHIPSKYADQDAYHYYFLQRVPLDRMQIYTYLISIYKETKNYQSAVNTAMDAMKYYPMDPQFYYMAADVLYDMGYLSQAIPLVIKAIQLKPDYVDALELQVKIKERFGKKGSEEDDLKLIADIKKKGGGWRREIPVKPIHHWDAGTLLYQIYR